MIVKISYIRKFLLLVLKTPNERGGNLYGSCFCTDEPIILNHVEHTSWKIVNDCLRKLISNYHPLSIPKEDIQMITKFICKAKAYNRKDEYKLSVIYFSLSFDWHQPKDKLKYITDNLYILVYLLIGTNHVYNQYALLKVTHE